MRKPASVKIKKSVSIPVGAMPAAAAASSPLAGGAPGGAAPGGMPGFKKGGPVHVPKSSATMRGKARS